MMDDYDRFASLFAPDGVWRVPDSVYHDRYQRTGDGWRFTERVDEVLYLDTAPLTGSPPSAAGTAAGPPPRTTPAAGQKGSQ